MCPRFIDDLIPIILESSDHWWPRDFLRLATVSPAWLGPVRRRLYERPSLCSFTACHLFARSLRENIHLHSLIRGIDLRPTLLNPHTPDFKLDEKVMSSLRYILSLDGFRIITLGGELAVNAERFLHSLVHPEAIIELHIDGTFDRGGCHFLSRKPASLEWDEVVAFKFPNLRKVRLSNVDLDLVYSHLPYELEVAELILDNVHIVGGYFHHFLNHSWSYLRHLFVITRTAAEFDEPLRLLLRFCGPTLESLHYEIGRGSSADTHIFPNLQLCPSLRQLHLHGVRVDCDALFVIAQFCRNLEELHVISRISIVSADQWVTFIRSAALPGLRKLVTPGGTYGPPFTHWSRASGMSVLEASAEQKIQCLNPPSVVQGLTCDISGISLC
jgi:hypothetical protein